jgi:ADP-heptose:LPS heptosyltransferase
MKFSVRICMGTTIVTLKAFGDFLIAYRALLNAHAINPAADIQLLAGEHVKPLGLALGVQNAHVHYVGGSTLKDVPAAFDARRHGLWAAWRSLVALRQAVHSAQPVHRQLVFDRLGMREQFIGGGRLCLALPRAAPNIYLAYDEYFMVSPPSAKRFEVGTARRALIVAASRVPRKVLPREVIAQVHQQLADRGVAAQVLLLEGEQVEVPRSVGLVRLPRQFSALVARLRETDIIVSADSLPAHIGEHLGKPTFVISPAPNPYWLPRAAFLEGGHGVFGNLENLEKWLDQL